jgi:hypothetical protein
MEHTNWNKSLPDEIMTSDLDTADNNHEQIICEAFLCSKTAVLVSITGASKFQA